MFSKYVGSWLSDGNKRSSLSKYSCFELLISLTTLFRATLFPPKVIFFGLSEDASAFPYLTYDKACTCNPWIIVTILIWIDFTAAKTMASVMS